MEIETCFPCMSSGEGSGFSEAWWRGGGVIQEGHLFDIMAHKGRHLFGRGHLLECELKM